VRSSFIVWAGALALGVSCGTTTNPCAPCTQDSDCSNGVCADLGGASYCATACPNGDECSGAQQCMPVTTTAGATTNACVDPQSTTCGPEQDGGADGGASIGPNGGTEPTLFFAVVGDTRPATEDDTAHYPTAVITKIFADLSAMAPSPPFVVSTGDYQFSNPYGSQATAQLQLYLAARGSYAGLQFPTMGNHECTGGTASNCGSGNANGVTNNYQAFMSMLLGPIQKTTPYYTIEVDAPDSSWTSKFVFVAANAWDATQAAWLDSALAQQTTYTFVVRHEPASANTAPGVTPSEAIMAKHPYTLAIVGHSHEYHHSSSNPREVIIGNGGAPLSTAQNYGYGIVAQRSDGAVQVDMHDYQSNAPNTSFRFAVNPDGSPAP